MLDPRVLWADDQDDVARSLARTLTELRCDVEFVGDAEEALSRLQTSWYDCAIIDLRMPPTEWGGLWLLEQLQGQRTPPIIVLSGEGGQRETIAAMRLGAGDYVVKDDAQDELASRVSSLLEGRQASAMDDLAAGEGQAVEFKASLRFNLETGSKDRRLEHASIKTIAGFLNSPDGGTLYIGVSDAGHPVGIAPDLELLNHPERDARDRFAAHLTQVVLNELGALSATLVDLSFLDLDENVVCRVSCPPAGSPIWHGLEDERKLYVRMNNTTQHLLPDKAEPYIMSRWP